MEGVGDMTDTSVLALNEVRKTLPNSRRRVLEALEIPSTNMEIAMRLGQSINTITPRTLELRHSGLVESAGKRRCRVTGMLAHTWQKSYAHELF